LPQEPDFAGHATTLAYVEAGLGPGDDHYQARYVLEQLGLHGDEEPSNLSAAKPAAQRWRGCWRPRPDILLLDEPTNHLDLTTIEWLESELDSRRSALVIIATTAASFQICRARPPGSTAARSGKSTAGFGAFEAWRDEVLAEEEREQHKLDRRIVNEEHWLRYGVSGRRKRNVKRLGNLHALRQQRRDHRGAAGNANLTAAEAENPAARPSRQRTSAGLYGNAQNRRWLLDPRPARRPHRHRRAERRRQDHADRNAHRRQPPDTGTIRLGANIEMATLDQHRESSIPNRRWPKH